ncbi:MFS transporter [Janthinobacterium lividum]|uniref:MFS transporter n=1 Tax=Janthinobacterium lividum TaxID=29581 RepID=A0ABU0XYY7_9BURK|nr:MFS transporter [Janthinobacterium lividum]MDQ4628816.1 MFS transporter [Janthinobacterium lividum]MDQ4677238.1 MFS transporter [Janthinobacterium lividum]MDQ4687775.1 MFS transporter [Janthinobacterium lividum]
MSTMSSRTVLPSAALPLSIYLLSLCSFAFGLCEFIAAGLLTPMARDLHASVAAAGGAIAAYALGAAIGAPILTAMLARRPVRQVLVATMLVLAAGSVAMAAAPALGALLGVRFAVGLAHGVFMAVASHAATSLVDPSRAGRALSIVWLGLTLALAGGVPLGTWLGAVSSWRWVFAAIGVLALCGGAGLRLAMPAARQQAAAASALASLRAILQPPLLLAAGVAALVSVATFSFFTYVSPFLLQLGGLDAGWLGAAMLCFGVCAIGGNLLGGWCADRPHALRSTVLALAALALNLLGFYLLRAWPLAMLALCGTLGLLFFALVTLSTMRLLRLAQRHCPGSDAVAAGLNIAAFNAGTAFGGALGGALIVAFGLPSIAIGGALAALLAMLLLWFQAQKLDSPL